MKILLFAILLVSLYDRNYNGLDWGNEGAYGRDDKCECAGDPDCHCDQ